MGARDGVISSVIEDFCASLWPSSRGLAENFRAALYKSVNKAFRAGSTGSPFHADTAIDGFTISFSEGAASDDGDGSAKGEDDVDHPANREVELLIVFLRGLSR